MNKLTVSVLPKFTGCLLGGLAGDCCGADYEGDKLFDQAQKEALHKSLRNLEKNIGEKKCFTDDTVMTMAVAKCIIEHRSLPSAKLAEIFTNAYFKNPNRGYGSALPKVFVKLKATNFQDPLSPAREQFNGAGSFGNGAAMRVAPVSLFCFQQSEEELINLVKQSAVVTHTHYLAINGAILQALAIKYCLEHDQTKFERKDFLNYLYDNIKKVESGNTEGTETSVTREYEKQINVIEQFLLYPPSDQEVVERLGHNVEALYSVPTAIYCFLKVQSTNSKIHSIFRRVLENAIQLGGDTDTIACMAGSLVGALYGESIISRNLLDHLEANSEVESMAEELYKVYCDTRNNEYEN